ncbi:MAG: hypothetical protein IJU39_01220 [Clostridia bacterium]|nr:hypothetical protein [Clostridia bacterium]
MENDLHDIISSLSREDIDNLKEVAQSVFGTDEKPGGSADLPDLSSIDPKMLGKITSVMSMLNKKDSRVELISALKPFLSSDRQVKADEAMKIIRLFELIPILKEQG